MQRQDSTFETIVEATAQTVANVSRIYHAIEQERSPDIEDAATDRRETRSYPFGTPFSDIIRFTSEVEVFTRHIDTFTREHFMGQSEHQKQNVESKDR